ncbi:MAG: universal stress protein, partial [Okeania sp. SIO2D1]|nr:universal stress protein [Okeania sp. SIO2D1]
VSNLALPLLPVQVIIQVALGVGFGYLSAHLLTLVLTKLRWTQHVVQDTLIAACLALTFILLAQKLPYFSGYLVAMAIGFFLTELDAPLARRLRVEFNHLWIVAEIVLFVIMGASIQLKVLGNILVKGSLILLIGLLLGRPIGWYLSTVKSNWNWREKLFLLPGNSAKATVQAAIGAIPFSEGIAGGDIILAVAALAILITAPLGAWAIPTFAPHLLKLGEVDPTKVTVAEKTVLLAAVNTDTLANKVLTKAAQTARKTNGEVIVLHVNNDESSQEQIAQLQQQVKRLLADINYQFLTFDGTTPEEISRIAQQYQVTDIIMGQRKHKQWEKILLGSVSQAVLETSSIPVILVYDQSA